MEVNLRLRPQCDFIYPEQFQCVMGLAGKFDSVPEFCFCPPACVEQEYQVVLSYGKWPSSSTWHLVAESNKVKFQNETVTEKMVLEHIEGTY